MSAKQVLDSCQSLYERHKLLTYPRSDSRYLPAEHYADRNEIITAIKTNAEALTAAVDGADQALKSKAWNDSKVDAHHAIIPTAKKAGRVALSQQENNIYELVARQYLMQFYPPYEYSDSEINLTIAGGQFRARARQAVAKGWKQLLGERSEEQSNSLNQQLPELKKGQSCLCEQGQVIEKQTTPPKHFDDASLLAAMTGVARYVQDPEIREVLKETDGLGTEATRAGIIELLFSREFLQRQGKLIKSTAAGKGLINSLPVIATYPDMTANWEMMLNAISLKQGSYQQFMQPLQQRLTELVEESQQVLPVGLKDIQLKKKPFKKFRSSAGKKRSA
jgi:DNA topoisomerase-3